MALKTYLNTFTGTEAAFLSNLSNKSYLSLYLLLSFQFNSKSKTEPAIAFQCAFNESLYFNIRGKATLCAGLELPGSGLVN